MIDLRGDFRLTGVVFAALCALAALLTGLEQRSFGSVRFPVVLAFLLPAVGYVPCSADDRGESKESTVASRALASAVLGWDSAAVAPVGSVYRDAVLLSYRGTGLRRDWESAASASVRRVGSWMCLLGLALVDAVPASHVAEGGPVWSAYTCRCGGNWRHPVVESAVGTGVVPW